MPRDLEKKGGGDLHHMLVKYDQNRVVQTIQNFVLFDKKWLTIFDKVLTPRWKTFPWLKQLFDAKILIQRLSSFSVPKFWHSERGRPDQA